MTKTIKMTHLLHSVFTSHPPAKDNSTHFCVQPCWRMSAVLLLWRCPLTLRPTQHYYDKLLSASWLIYKPWTDNNRPFHNSLLFYWSFQRWTSSEHTRSVTESQKHPFTVVNTSSSLVSGTDWETTADPSRHPCEVIYTVVNTPH